MTRRTAVTCGLLSAVVGPLAGCGAEAPDPYVTVFSGTTSKRAEAVCWQTEGSVDAQACQEEANRGPTVRVVPGEVVGIALPPEVAERGWAPFLGGQALVAAPLTGSYFRFRPGEQELAQSGALQVVMFAGEDDTEQVRGIWGFRLRRS